MTKKTDDKKWHSGPPPSVGWWPTSRNVNIGNIRWWDGKNWSIEFWEGDTGFVPMRDAHLHHSPFQNEIKWKHRPASWPARSRT